jgi:SecD/SecF fusion protein
MTRPPVLRALAALIILGLTGFFAVTKDPRLGLDLRGGTSITLETKDSPTTEADAESTDRALEVLRRRVDALGVAEPTLARSGSNRIIVELPGLQNAAEAAEQLGQTAQLTFHPVLGLVDPSQLPGQPPVPGDPAAPPVDPAAPPVDPAAPPVDPAAPPVDPAAPPADPAAPPAVPPVDPAAPPAPAPAPVPQGRAMLALPGDQVPPPSPVPVEPAPVASEPAPVEPAPAPSASEAPELLPAEPADEAQFDASQQQAILDENNSPIIVGPAALTGEGVGDASSQVDQQTGTGRFVSIDFRGNGGRLWEELTGAAACQPPGDPKRRVAIVLDGRAISSPQVDPSVQCNIGIQGGSTQITGDFTQQEGEELAVLIKGGALPVPVEIISRSTVGPTLGAEAIDASVKAGIIGLIMTTLFLIVVYRFVGFLAAVALASYGLISYGALVALGATLTLPGLGGLLLSAGLAIDANVLVFERAREEFAASRSKRLMPALNNGFAKAFSAIADSNITTLLAAGLLFLLASGPVRGFGVTLVIGVLASVISALLVTRVFTEFGLKRGLIGKRPRITGLASLGRFREWLERRKPDLMKFRKRYLMITAALLVLAIAGMFVRGFNFGVEFTGGRVVEYANAQGLSVGDAREAVSDAGFPTAVVQESNGENITVRTANIDDAQVESIRSSLAEAGGGDVSVISDDLIGPTLGNELRTKAILALGIALLAQLAYLAVRFRWTFAAGTVLAMFHDVILVLGIFAWLGKPIDGIFLAAALTIIGVSVNDSVVTMDRIRETWAGARTKPLASVVNSAIIATAPRTINTGLGAFFILGALVVLGGRSLTDFALALLIGLFVGTYSSAFVASPLVLLFEQKNNAPPPMPKRKNSSAAKRPRPASKRPASRPVKLAKKGEATA